MKQERIYTNEWMEWHPYKRTTVADRYYTNLATRVYKILHQSHIVQDPQVMDEDLRRAACCLTAYFEDVVSQIGIWKAFTTECERLYGKPLPFYYIEKDSYFNDETNEEDVRFLLWHHIQQTRDRSVVNPENRTIQLVAEEIHNLLADEYETAPENKQLQDFFSPDNRYDTFFDYRKLLEWFHYHCYFNAFNNREMTEALYAEEEDWEEKEYTYTLCKSLQYSIVTDLCFSGRSNMLSLTSPEWLSRIYGPEFQQAKRFAEVVRKQHTSYLFNKEDEFFIYVTGLRTKENLRIDRSSMGDTSTLIPGHSAITCILAQYNGEWQQYGAMVCHPEQDVSKIQTIIKNEDIQEKATLKIYDSFLKKCKGIPFVYINSHEEHLFFLKQVLKCNLPADFSLPDNYPEKCILTAAGKKGLLVVELGIACVKDKRNPFYNAEQAEEKAFLFYTRAGACPIQLVYYLHDNGMLPDAGLNSVHGKEHGKILMQENYDFFIRYFLQCCRDKDLD